MTNRFAEHHWDIQGGNLFNLVENVMLAFKVNTALLNIAGVIEGKSNSVHLFRSQLFAERRLVM